jgi:hypothetical protein
MSTDNEHDGKINIDHMRSLREAMGTAGIDEIPAKEEVPVESNSKGEHAPEEGTDDPTKLPAFERMKKAFEGK